MNKEIDQNGWLRAFPRGVCRDIIIDTDTANETDDQFALAWALFHKEDFRIRGIYAAPFLHERVVTEAEGMMESYREILRVLSMFPDRDVPVYPGCSKFLSRSTPEPNPAVMHLIRTSQGYTRENPLRVVAIAALSNIATALELDPTLAERIELWWLGGQHYGRGADEFNLSGDLVATSIVLGNRALTIHLFPCAEIAETLRLDFSTLRERILPNGALGRLLYCRFHRQNGPDYPERSRAIWDLAPFLAMNRPEFVTMVCRERRVFDCAQMRWLGALGVDWWMCEAFDVQRCWDEFFERLEQHHKKYPYIADVGN